jgi:hypothetical protein
MRMRKLNVVAVLLFMTTLGIVQASADEEAGGTATVGGSVSAKLSAQDMQARGEAMVAEMEATMRRMTERQIQARTAKDIIKLNCVNDKLLQVKQLLNIADDARVQLQVAGDDREHAYTEITLASEKVATLGGEADGCVGEGEIFVGATKVSVSAPRVIDDPTTIDPFHLGGIEIERPTYATPFL